MRAAPPREVQHAGCAIDGEDPRVRCTRGKMIVEASLQASDLLDKAGFTA